MPAKRIVRWITSSLALLPNRLFASIYGSTCSVMATCISYGTPGREINSLVNASLLFRERPEGLQIFSKSIIGALPTRLGSMVADCGTSHWVAVRRLSTSGRSLYSSCICARTWGSSTSVVPKYSHSTCLVISSLVGPKPPVVKTISAREKASSSALRIC